MDTYKGRLEVICGSMFCGKSEELIRRLRRAEIARKNILVFKHSLDDRTTLEHVVSHNGTKIRAFPVEKHTDILKLVTPEIDIVGIDEVQFFEPSVVATILELVDKEKHVIAAGLDLDFRGIPFGSIPPLLAVADSVIKLKAICIQCGNDAHFSQRLVNGKPAKFNDPIVMIGAEESYQARCRECFKIDLNPKVNYEQKQL
ncbi:thymidine kinase [bacterium]|jgi:thymidine kinase|nr:thymidine kinase [bacterium]MBT5015126.1 thymidine kinase [bacterium]